MFLDDGLVEAGGLFELVLLHEEYVGHVKLPHVVLVTELHRLTEDLLHLRVVLQVPVDLSLLHQYWDVPVRGGEGRLVYPGLWVETIHVDIRTGMYL